MAAAEGPITRDMTVNDVIKAHPGTIEVFARFAVDSCCGGAVSVEAAAERDGADIEALMAELNRAA